MNGNNDFSVSPLWYKINYGGRALIQIVNNPLTQLLTDGNLTRNNTDTRFLTCLVLCLFPVHGAKYFFYTRVDRSSI